MEIILNSQYVALIANKTDKKELKDVNFRVSIHTEKSLSKL